ncbi:MAG TPA: DUF1549 domain-containing protein [Pirellulaceae bacterium]|mgnify:CR=1 FL=1|nr:DUF1549 domain-containing protein [Pirellulaceae bacterium]HMO90590.1 DUF1549 domain-containing protein [Pirellulaceae bacterium]HMP67831.1 DUF1549 domain-containing protein [Pirellulaceae bacterium]
MDKYRRLVQMPCRHTLTSLFRVCFVFNLGFAWTCFAQTDLVHRGVPEQVQQINQLVAEQWQAYNLRPSPPASDAEWCRRIYLDILGRIPRVEELDDFLGSKDKDKRSQLVNRLLYDDTYTEEYARNWTTLWTNLLIGRTGGTDNNSQISREGMQKYLRDSFARNKPYHRMVYELVTATGSPAPRNANFNGAVNFLIDKVNMDDAAQATAATTKTFLGLQVQCTQCHNHPFNEWKQDKYWEINAFFRQTRARNAGRRAAAMNETAELVDVDYRGPAGIQDSAEIYYDLRNGEVAVAYPVFVDGTSIERDGRVDVVNRRQKLGELIVESPYLGMTMVNRTWAHFLGYGFTKPVDDMGPHNPPSHPELLEYLTNEFRKYDYDLRSLITWIVLSQPYALSSKISAGNKSDDPLLGETPKFSRFYVRQMRAEELYESLVVATQAEGTQGSYEEQERQKNLWLRQFASAFGTDEGDETTTFNGTIPQVLMMFNGELMRAATSSDRGSLIARLANNPRLKDRDRFVYLFKAGLSRTPTRDELNLCEEILKINRGNQTEALKDVWWTILNTNEFIFNH